MSSQRQRPKNAILHADAALLTRALENVLQNAVRHNAGPITLALHADADETTLHLTIQDDGTGYPQSVLAVLNGEPEGENAPHILGLHVVAEGVETSPQLDKLTAMACDCVQGYVFSRPLPETAALTFATPDP